VSLTPRIRALAAPLRTAACTSLGPLEAHLLRVRGGEPTPVCFVIGPPRSGTTLLYQLLVTRFRLAYFSNFAHRLHRTPASASLIGRGPTKRWAGRFESEYGHVRGWFAPNEGGAIWNRWIPQPHAVDMRSLPQAHVDEMRKTVYGVANVLGSPFLNKNVMHSVHMDALGKAFPGCLFIRIRRDEDANVRSILLARSQGAGPEAADGWWSVKPAGWRAWAAADPETQAVAQVRGVHDDIDSATAVLGERRVLDVEYEALCEHPVEIMRRVGRFFEAHGFALSVRGSVPPSFPRPTVQVHGGSGRVETGSSAQ
jgi:hypothetical protein